MSNCSLCQIQDDHHVNLAVIDVQREALRREAMEIEAAKQALAQQLSSTNGVSAVSKPRSRSGSVSDTRGRSRSRSRSRSKGVGSVDGTRRRRQSLADAIIDEADQRQPWVPSAGVVVVWLCGCVVVWLCGCGL